MAGKRKIFNYKGVCVNSFGIPVSGNLQNRYRKNKTSPKRQYLQTFISDFEKNSPRNLILMYDIPSKRKKDRDWFRRQLKNFDFIMIQKSVWVGPSPLPKDFLEYLKMVGLQKEFKTFKLAKSYTDKF